MNDSKLLMILERSSSTLQKITKNGKTVLEGVFAEFGVENRNGRIYEEKEYLPHLEYLKKDINNNNLLGELDHPERFEVALGNVSHRISELWYDQQKRQVLGRIEVLDTPKGQIAKSLLEAGIPLSISSRAAGTVNEDKTVQIQQIYTFDLVAKPGFESAQLHSVNESANPKIARVANLVKRLNESYSKQEEDNLSSKLGIINENVSILDLSDKFPSVALREEAKELLSSKNKENKEIKKMEKPELMEDVHLQQWTLYFKNALSSLNERLDKIENLKEGTSNPAVSKELDVIKKYVEKLRGIQEESLNWQSEIAIALNKVGNYADKLAEKSNAHYDLTNKIVETVDYNAKTLNKTQDWVGSVATVTNAIGETVDHNAKMLNGINEWNTQIAKAVNHLNEWNEEIAPAVNGMHEWTSSIAQNLNKTVNWTEDMLGRAISKEEATKLIEYIDLVGESKQDPELKNKIEEMLKIHSITAKPLNEKAMKGLEVIDSVGKVGNVKVDTETKKSTGVEFDKKTNTIISKIRNIKLKSEGLPKGLKSDLQMELDKDGAALPKDGGCCNDPKDLLTGLKKTKTLGGKDTVGGNPKANIAKAQNLKLNIKPGGKGLTNESENINRTEDIQARKANLDEKLEKIAQSLEKERAIDEQTKSSFPFTTLLSEVDRKRFNGLAPADKTKVAYEVAKVPSIDPKIIVKTWENALTEGKVEEPLWFSAASKEYKELFTNAPEALKESIKARAEFYELSTDYQINNFWETSGLVHKPTFTLNESVVAKPITKDGEQKVDTFVAQIAEQLKRYNQ
jgi:hypothetical protein